MNNFNRINEITAIFVQSIQDLRINYLYYTTFSHLCKYIYQVVEKRPLFIYNFLVWETIKYRCRGEKYETYYTFGF